MDDTYDLAKWCDDEALAWLASGQRHHAAKMQQIAGRLRAMKDELEEYRQEDGCSTLKY